MTRLRTFTSWLGLLGALGAVIWAARDRFFTLTLPRESEPPTFREGSPASKDAHDLTAIAGIGPVFSERLKRAGVGTWSDLAKAEPEHIAEVTGASRVRATGWIAEAANRVEA